MCRRVRSPILYQQMRGRGTRTAPHIGKSKFVIYDFFGNHQRFNDSDTDIFTGVGQGRASSGGSQPTQNRNELIELGLEDEWLEAVAYVEIGPEGERVDKKDYVSNWEQTIRNAAEDDEILRKVRDGKELSETEEQELTDRLNQPKMFFNEDNLRRAYRRPDRTLVDFIKTALGLIKNRTREEEINENFQAWLVSRSLSPEQSQYLAMLKNRGIVRGSVSLDDLFKPPLSILNATAFGIELFGEKGLKEVIDDLNESIFSKKAAA